MGRSAKPAELKRAQGNPGKRPLAEANLEDLPELQGGPPGHLNQVAKKAWAKLAPDLERLKLLRATDRAAFARYCEHLAEYDLLTRKIKRRGHTYETESNHGKMRRMNPDFMARERIENRLEALEDRFGLSPRARYQVLQAMASHPLAAPPQAGELPLEPQPAQEPGSGSPVGILSRGTEQLH